MRPKSTKEEESGSPTQGEEEVESRGSRTYEC